MSNSGNDNDEPPKLTVPKFSSFKTASKTKESEPPKFSSFKPKVSAKESAQEQTDHHHKDRGQDSRKRHRHTESNHRRDDKHRHRHHRDRSQPQAKPESRTNTSDQHQSTPKSLREGTGVSGLYIVDTKGDPLVFQLGEANRRHVPSYLRYGSGQVLGTTGRLVIHRDGPREEFSIRMPGEGPVVKDKGGLRSKSWRVRSKPIRIRKQAVSPDDDEEDEGFLEIRAPKRRKREHGGHSSSDEEDQPTYRSIEGKAKPHQYSDSDLDYGSEPQDEVVDDAEANPLRWKSIQLRRQVKDHPDNIDAWIELANHQDDLLRAGEDIDRKALEGEKHSFAEIKVSMLESALKNVSKAEDRERVLVPLMREGVKIWNSQTASKKWAELLDKEQSSFELWRTYINFATSNLATFQYEAVRELYVDRLRHVVSQFSEPPSSDGVGEAIYTFLRATRFVHDAGYKEHAVSAWQALLEMNLFPPSEQASHEDAITAFRDFWESEVPRIGEPGAKGWDNFVESGGLGDPPEPSENKSDRVRQSRDDYKYWGALESSNAEKAKMPARTMDEGNDDDPFRVVMFSDIEPLLFLIPKAFTKRLSPQLIDAFLIFCRFPPFARSSTWTELACHDQFLQSSGSEVKYQTQTTTLEPSEEIHRQPPSFEQGGLHVALSTDMLFGSSNWFSYLPPKCKDWSTELEFLLNVTKRLVHCADGTLAEELGEYYLALCAARDGSDIKKPAKALLKKYGVSLHLYHAYAMAELSSGNLDAATNVLTLATDLVAGSRTSAAFGLWRTWAWIELGAGKKQMALKRLCSSVDNILRRAGDSMEASYSHTLKARRAFLGRVGDSISKKKPEEATVFAECATLLEYLTGDNGSEPTSAAQGSVFAAMELISSISQKFQTQGLGATLSHERVLQCGAKLMYFNASRGPFRRAFMLERLSQFITLFPRNTMFLSLFEWVDSSLRVVDEVRTLMYEKVLIPSQDCVSSRLFAIQHEVRRGNTNLAKAAFEHAVDSDACKFSVPLWIQYIRFCDLNQELRGKAKDVLLRAVRNCPWSKDVMMEAFLTLSREMESSELRSVFHTMTSKGLRVHVDLEEFLEKERGERKRSGR